MRILIDMHMVGENETGNETYIVNLVKGLKALRSGDEFFLATTNADLLGQTIPFDADCHACPVSQNPFRRLLLDLPRAVRKHDIDLLHVTYAGPFSIPCPMVVTIHDMAYERNAAWFSPRDRFVLATGIRMTAPRASAIITISECSRRDIVAFLHIAQERVHVTYPAAAESLQQDIPAPHIAGSILKRFGVRKPYILAVGNLQPRKNLSRLIQAYADLVNRSHVDHQLVIVGKANWKESEVFRTCRKNNMTDRVLFTGYVLEEELPAFYHEADLFAYPSLFEGFGLPILEAMSCGTAVLTSDVSSMPEVAGAAAQLVDPGSIASIREGLEAVLLNLARRRDLENLGRERARMFSWRRTAEETLRVYRSVVRVT
ncbi:MAG: glycosyltransferase family 1 protein [Lentisphaerales bacterium]|nr:MAG: glycosyltransferase family 1 protein [Lentisphaerales bacterium]